MFLQLHERVNYTNSNSRCDCNGSSNIKTRLKWLQSISCKRNKSSKNLVEKVEIEFEIEV